jgi:cyclopropane fatty-acyl-phospholipid synthase-like methyltransferase
MKWWGKKQEHSLSPAAGVADFYNATTDKFLQVYGEVIQAFRTKNVEDYLEYTIVSAELQNGQHILDAGCGVCGPAIYFAQQLPQITIEACTISPVQVEIAINKIAEKNVSDRVKVTCGDYHFLQDLYAAEQFDRVLFLESFGHSKNKTLAIEAAKKVLKPGGKIYIKDLFVRESEDEWEQLRIHQICEQINRAYAYEVGNLYQVVSALRRKGFIVHYIRIPQIELSAFEHLSISNEFQNLFDIGKIESWDGYIFPIDFYEILAEKPSFHPWEQMHLYHLNK